MECLKDKSDQADIGHIHRNVEQQNVEDVRAIGQAVASCCCGGSQSHPTSSSDTCCEDRLQLLMSSSNHWSQFHEGEHVVSLCPEQRRAVRFHLMFEENPVAF